MQQIIRSMGKAVKNRHPSLFVGILVIVVDIKLKLISTKNVFFQAT